MVLAEAMAINDAFVLIFGTMTLLLVVLILIVFAFLFQRKLINRQKAFREIELLLQKQETKSTYAVLEAQELERKRIAEDLHDRLGSRLVAVKLHFHAFKNNPVNNQESFAVGSELLDGAVDEVREISHNLISGVLSKFGLVAALHDLKNALESTKELRVDIHVHHFDERIELVIEATIYRIVQELISNILKHSNATEVTIQLTKYGSDVLVIVEDNGIGFDVSSLNGKSGIGIKNIHSRINKLKGKVTIDSFPMQGTVVTIEIPLQYDQRINSGRPSDGD
ncbi:MAG TPA: sensor histidine kinase [Chryseolinea sp.]|nr:sensor histidine kinase [Chryseolinea sp.]